MFDLDPEQGPDGAWDDTPEALAARAAWRRRCVAEVVEIGLARMRRLRDAEPAVSSAVGGTAGPDPDLAYARVSRAVRLGLALSERFDKPAAAPAASGPAPVDYDELVRRRDGMRGVILSAQVANAVEAMIETEVDGDIGGLRATGLLQSLHERLEDDEELEAIGARSIGESVALICRDLGLSPDWDDWRLERWAIEEAREETLGSPFGRPRRAVWEGGGGDGGPAPLLTERMAEPP